MKERINVNLDHEITKWKNSPLMILYFIIAFMSITYAALDSFIMMVDRWGSSEEYGYAYLIPVITGYFIWLNRIEIQKQQYKLSWLGGIFLIFGLFVILLGKLSATYSIAQYGYIVAILSATFLFIGWKSFKIIIAPMMLLFLVVPLPGFIYNNLSSDLQLISSQIGVWVIRAFGISVFLDGNVIDLGKLQLQVVDACSGLRYLFPLVSLSIIVAFIYQAAFWKRAVIVISSIPITVLMNSFRIGMIGVLVEHGGIEQAEGFLHQFEGWIVFMACVGLLVLEMWLLVSFGSNKQKLSEVFSFELPANIPKGTKFEERPISNKRLYSLMAIVAIGIYIGTFDQGEEIIPERSSFASYPLKVGDWEGRRSSIEKIYLDELKLNDYIIADYANPTGDNVNLYVAYYDSQRSGAAVHSPRSCIPGGGWRIKSHSAVNIDNFKGAGKSITVNRLQIQKGNNKQLVYYWFQQRGRHINNEYLVKWYLFWDSLTRNRTDGALVRLTTQIPPGMNVSEGDKRLSSFMKSMGDKLEDFVPGI